MAQLKDLLVSGTVRILNGLNLNGNLTIAGNLIPSVNETYNIGESARKWRQIQTKYLSVGVGDIVSSGYTFRVAGNSELGGKLDVQGLIAGHSMGTSAIFGGTATNISGNVYTPTSGIIICAGSGSGNASTAIGFHNPNISSAIFGYYNTDANNGQFRLDSDDAYWDLAIGGTVKLSTVWGKANAVIGANGNDKIVIGYLASNTNCATIGAHNTGLTDWANLCVAGKNIFIRKDETTVAKFVDGCLSLYPYNHSYREGLRIHSYDSWSDILLCGNDMTGDSGSSANSWFLGNNNGNFYITRNGSDSSTSSYLSAVSNNWFFYGGKLEYNNGNAIISFYPQTNTTYGAESIAIQTCFDKSNPVESSYVTSYPERCNLLLQPRGGQTYIGYNLTTIGDTAYKLLVNGSTYINGSIKGLAVEGGIYWNPYVESASDASDAASITVHRYGAAGGTELRIEQRNDANDIINLVVPNSIFLNGKRAFRPADSWLRINEDSSFSSGIYTGTSAVRSDSKLQVGDDGNDFYANNSGNGYFRNTLGIAGVDTNYKLYVNGISYFYLPDSTATAENSPAIKVHGKLDIYDNIAGGGTANSLLNIVYNGTHEYGTVMKIHSYGGDSPSIRFSHSDKSSDLHGNPNTTWSVGMYYKTYDRFAITRNRGTSGWGTADLVIDSNGKVGIGTVAPNYTLEVIGNVASGTHTVHGSSTNDTEAGNFYYTGGLEVRESNYVGSSQSSFNYAPRIGFHWGGRVASTLSLHTDGIFYFRKQDGGTRSTIDANVNGNLNGSADMLDGLHESAFYRHDRASATGTDGRDDVWGTTGSQSFLGALPEGLSNLYSYGQLISFSNDSGPRFEIWASHISSQGNGLLYRTGWNTDKQAWRYFIDSANIGNQSVSYANSAGSATSATNAGNADTLDGYHASSFATAGHTHAYLPIAGGTMTGPLNFANGTYNVVGDDVAIGDINIGGCLGVRGLNGNTNIRLVQYGASTTSGPSAPGVSWTCTGDGTSTISGTLSGTFSGNLSGNASSATRAADLSSYSSNPTNSHPGYGARVFYSWNIGNTGSDSEGYSTGITIGSHPGDPNYGFQLVQNLWDDRLYTRRYNAGWQSWKTLAWTSDIPTSLPANGGNADTVDGYHASSLWRSDGATWNPNANVKLNASDNNQEWSFDISRNGKTGCYWHVWDSSLSTMLRVNADDGKVSAPYNFVGKLEGTTKTLAAGGNLDAPMTFNWYGQGGQPTWLWGGNDYSNIYVYNPSNFNVASSNKLNMQYNVVTSIANDTTSNWANMGCMCSFNTQPNQLNGQPSQYGLIFSMGTPIDVHQIWMTQANGSIYHRGGNSAGWNGSWSRFLTANEDFYRPGSSFTVHLTCGGFCTEYAKNLYFTIPLDMPTSGVNGVSIQSSQGLIIRQNNKYLYNSAAGVYVQPSSYTARLSHGTIWVYATFANTVNATNNSPCGVTVDVVVTFS